MFAKLLEHVLAWSAHPRAPLYLGAVSFAESSFFPIPPDVLLAPMVLSRPERAWRLAAWTTLWSVVGGVAGDPMTTEKLEDIRVPQCLRPHLDTDPACLPVLPPCETSEKGSCQTVQVQRLVALGEGARQEGVLAVVSFPRTTLPRTGGIARPPKRGTTRPTQRGTTRPSSHLAECTRTAKACARMRTKPLAGTARLRAKDTKTRGKLWKDLGSNGIPHPPTERNIFRICLQKGRR